MSFDEFFTNLDKPFAENLNDALLLVDAFDVTVPCEMPSMFSNGEFSSTVDVARKCDTGIVTLKSVASGVTVGTDEISGSGDVVFRVYPNFNSFYKWNKIILESTGTVSVAFKKTDGTSISATVGADGTISEATALKTLQEIDVVLSLTSASITGILIEWINNQSSSRTRAGALLEASQLANVDGTVAENDTKAVNGDTVNTALNGLASDIADDIADLSDSVSGDLSTLSDTIDGKLDLKESLSNKVTTLDNSSTHYPTTGAIQPFIQMINDLITIEPTLTVISDTDGNLLSAEIKSNLTPLLVKTSLLNAVSQVSEYHEHNMTNKKLTISQLFTNKAYVVNTIKLEFVYTRTNTVVLTKTFDSRGNEV